MPTTSNRAFRYPASSAAPNVPQDIQNLAADVDAQFAVTYAAVTISANWAQANLAVGGPTINEKASCWLDTDDVTVHVTGAIVNTATTTSNTVYNPWITLPSGYRPAVAIRRYVHLSTNNNNAPVVCVADIYTTGAVALGNSVGVGINSLYTFDWTFRLSNA